MTRPTTIVFALLLALALSAQETPAPAEHSVLAWAPPTADRPDGVVFAANNGLLARFNPTSDEQELLADDVVTFALSPDGRRLAVAALASLTLHRAGEFRERSSLEMPAAETLSALAWSPDGATLAGGTGGGHLHLWDVEGGELWADLAVDPPAAITRLSFSADGRRLLAALEDGRGVLFDLEQQVVLQQLRSPHSAPAAGEAATMVLSPDGRRVLATWLASKSPELVLLAEDGRLEWRRTGYGLDFTPDGRAVLALAPPFRIAALYRTDDALALATFEPPQGVRRLHTARLSANGRRLLAVAEDDLGQLLVLWDVETARVLHTRR